MKSTIRSITAALTAGIIVASCGGGGGGALGGIDRLGVTGPITKFGSVFVNGVEWRTTGATVKVDGQDSLESDLQVGQIVTIRGTLDSDGKGGAADSVELVNNVEGVVLAVNTDTGVFVILGQNIIVNSDTSMDPALPGSGIVAISIGDRLLVSGFVDSTGNIYATRVQKSAAMGPESLLGKVGTVNTAAKTFAIGGLQVDYTPPATLTGFPGADPVSGNLVLVVGTRNGSNVLVADSVAMEQVSAPAASGDDGEVQGLVTRFVSVADFDVAGVAVTTTAQTVFTGGTSADIVPGAKLEVEGTVDTAGRIVAKTIEIRNSAAAQDVVILADLDGKDVAAGTVTLLGITVDVNTETRIEDKSAVDLRPLTLADLDVPGIGVTPDHIRIHGVAESGNRVLATRLEREDKGETEVILTGTVSAKAAAGFTILGTDVQPDAQTLFYDSLNNVVTEQAFFSALAVGDVIEVKSLTSLVGIHSLTPNEVRQRPLDD
jgi:hypothetical protein